MSFDSIYSFKRFGSSKESTGIRSGFQRDYDRLIFSSAFRRLQNKTQVFPLPGTAFVHNRLTHSLEVASVGRSLGKMVGERICGQYKLENEGAYEFYKYELANVIAAACLAHDIGNPAFGHSGEKAISAYFIEHAEEKIESASLRTFYNDQEWADISEFEGNANAIRVLTHSFKGRFNGGFGLTYTTIASILKYPCESVAVNKQYRHRKKYGFFQSEKETMMNLFVEMKMPVESGYPLIAKRHPFVYLVEAADDICYNIIDMEDAQRLHILSKKEVEECFMGLMKSINRPGEDLDRLWNNYNAVADTNEAIAFLRARVINVLISEATDVFWEFRNQILKGDFNDTLLDHINQRTKALNEVKDISIHKIYGHDVVVQIEIAGFNVMSELLDLFIPALLTTKPSQKQLKILDLLPYQFTEYRDTDNKYLRTLNALDLISGMTDEYATDLYRKLKGIVIPGLK